MMADPEAPNSDAPFEARVQVDLGNMADLLGRVKEAPVCVDETLKQEAMTTEDLSKLTFPLETPVNSFCSTEYHLNHHEPSVVSSSSSTASRESFTISDGEMMSQKIVSTPLRLERRQSEQINSKVTSITKSRNGRQSQRWFSDPHSHRMYRMVTGCVPIVKGGKVLFISSSRKPEWILPKGGWEQDEAMEESAIRETFEEGGVLGILGPRLGEIEYETRKAKKRRLEREELQRRVKLFPEGSGSLASEKQDDASTFADSTSTASVSEPQSTGPLKLFDETNSVTSESSSGAYTHVRMTLFPLYVSEVKSEWPECGRFRKAVDIDEAIRLCESRPELRAALKEVKDRNLHHLHETVVSPSGHPDR
eukprot:Nitzschia sp. Nitz4//scaffold170_size48074//22272//23366//NITZ4_007105-RA/size48074-processed-gene-0.20-mRNA-1//-1//CDS//3329538640//1060//frame0